MRNTIVARLTHSFTLARIGGIPVLLHWSLWMYIVGFIAWQLCTNSYSSASHAVTHVFNILLIAGFLFGSVLLHELAHAGMAGLFRHPTRRIILLPFGGLAEIALDKMPPRTRLLVAVAGPMSNLALGALLIFMDVEGAFKILAEINLILGAFNLLVPLWPMDSGLIIESWLLHKRVPRQVRNPVMLSLSTFGALFVLGLAIHQGNFLLVLLAIFLWYLSYEQFEHMFPSTRQISALSRRLPFFRRSRRSLARPTRSVAGMMLVGLLMAQPIDPEQRLLESAPPTPIVEQVRDLPADKTKIKESTGKQTTETMKEKSPVSALKKTPASPEKKTKKKRKQPAPVVRKSQIPKESPIRKPSAVEARIARVEKMVQDMKTSQAMALVVTRYQDDLLRELLQRAWDRLDAIVETMEAPRLIPEPDVKTFEPDLVDRLQVLAREIFIHNRRLNRLEKSLRTLSEQHRVSEKFHDDKILNLISSLERNEALGDGADLTLGWALTLSTVLLVILVLVRTRRKKQPVGPTPAAVSDKPELQMNPIPEPGSHKKAIAAKSLLEPAKIEAWRIGMATHKGPVRAINEDSIQVLDTGDLQVALVADGCGGMPMGRLASMLAVNGAVRALMGVLFAGKCSGISTEEVARMCLEGGRTLLTEAGRQLGITQLSEGLRTTLLVTVASKHEIGFAYIGDGGGWVLRRTGEVEQFLEPQKVDPDNLNQLAATLGPTPHGQSKSGTLTRNPGDLILTGTDGVFDNVSERFAKSTLQQAILQKGNLTRVAEDILDSYAGQKQASGTWRFSDNLTLALIGDGEKPKVSPGFWKSLHQGLRPQMNPLTETATV